MVNKILTFGTLFFLFLLVLPIISAVDISLNDTFDLDDVHGLDFSNDRGEIMIKWNITSIPVGATVTNGTLCMRLDLDAGVSAAPNVTYVPNQTWNEADMDTTEYDAIAGDISFISTFSETTQGSFSCTNVTSLLIESYGNGDTNFTLRISDSFASVGKMSGGGSMNNGVTLLIGEDTFNEGVFDSAEAVSQAERPFLNVSYDLASDAIPPNVTIRSPTAGDFSSTTTLFNVTSLDLSSSMDSCLYSINNWVDNNTMSNATGVITWDSTNSSMAQGAFTVKFACNDSSNNWNNTESISFSIDSIDPIVAILFPTNVSYGVLQTAINFSATDDNLDSCIYSLDGGTTNVTINCAVNVTDLVTQEGSFELSLWANDSLNNVGLDTISFRILLPPCTQFEGSIYPVIKIITALALLILVFVLIFKDGKLKEMKIGSLIMMFISAVIGLALIEVIFNQLVGRCG